MMNFYFQFLTNNQTVDAVEMLHLIGIITDSPVLGGRVRISAQASISRSTFSSIEALCSRLKKKRFNELESLPDPLPVRLGGVDARIISLNAVYYPSPTCALWLPTKDWRIDAERSSRNKYMTAKTKEDVLKNYQINQKPSVLEVAIKIAGKSPPSVPLDGCASLLATMLPENLGKLQLFGCCDFGGPELGVRLDAGVPSTGQVRVMAKVKPPDYKELGHKFDNLHPLMFGSKRLCEGVSKALGIEAALTVASHVNDFAVVRLVPNCDKDAARNHAAKWLMK